MKLYDRWYGQTLKKKLQRPFVHIMFGARQTGKSTLINAILPKNTMRIDLANPFERNLYLLHPEEIINVCKALPQSSQANFVFVDEVQTVPEIFDAVQHLYDSDKNRWRFILCGSSTRKLRKTGSNLLPGRSFLHHLFPLTLAEQPDPESAGANTFSPLPLPWPKDAGQRNRFSSWSLEMRLAFGALPGIVTADEDDRGELLKAYAMVYLEEEIRRESLVKDWRLFVRFVQLAAAESGQILNYSNISQETGISNPTVKSHYQLLEDMFIGFTVPAFLKSPRKSILSSPKFLFFDLGVRHAAAGLTPSLELVRANPGLLFEQWVGIELWKRLQYLGTGSLYYQRSRDGAEIDFIIENQNQLIPIEVKWSEHPHPRDARHLLRFMQENSSNCRKGYLVCRCKRPMELHENITAIPWNYL